MTCVGTSAQLQTPRNMPGFHCNRPELRRETWAMVNFTSIATGPYFRLPFQSCFSRCIIRAVLALVFLNRNAIVGRLYDCRAAAFPRLR